MAQVSSQMTPAERQEIAGFIESCGMNATPEAINTIAYGTGIKENAILGYQYAANSALETNHLKSIREGIADDKRPEHIIDTIHQRSPSTFSDNFTPELLNRISHVAARQYGEFKVGDTQPGNPDMWRLATLANSTKIAAGSYGPESNDLGSMASKVIMGPYGLWETLRGKIGLPKSGKACVAEAAESSQMATNIFIPYEKQNHRDQFYAQHSVKEVDYLTDPAILKTAYNVALAVTPKGENANTYQELVHRNELAIREMNALDVANVERMLAKMTGTEYSVLDKGLSIDGSGISIKDNDGLTVDQDKLQKSLEDQNGGVIAWDDKGKVMLSRSDYKKQLSEYWQKHPDVQKQIQALQRGQTPVAKAVSPQPPAATAAPTPSAAPAAANTASNGEDLDNFAHLATSDQKELEAMKKIAGDMPPEQLHAFMDTLAKYDAKGKLTKDIAFEQSLAAQQGLLTSKTATQEQKAAISAARKAASPNGDSALDTALQKVVDAHTQKPEAATSAEPTSPRAPAKESNTVAKSNTAAPKQRKKPAPPKKAVSTAANPGEAPQQPRVNLAQDPPAKNTMPLTPGSCVSGNNQTVCMDDQGHVRREKLPPATPSQAPLPTVAAQNVAPANEIAANEPTFAGWNDRESGAFPPERQGSKPPLRSTIQAGTTVATTNPQAKTTGNTRYLREGERIRFISDPSA